MPVATGMITTSKLVKPVYFAAFADHGYNNQEELVPVIIPDFIFEQGRSVLRTTEIKSAKGKATRCIYRFKECNTHSNHHWYSLS